jgi:hypothetical protein
MEDRPATNFRGKIFQGKTGGALCALAITAHAANHQGLKAHKQDTLKVAIPSAARGMP